MNINPKTVGAKRPATAPAADKQVFDPLADALLFLAAHHGRAISRDALLAGLPITDGPAARVALFERAAHRAGLEAEAVKRAIDDIPALVLPAVLMMRDGSTRILLETDPDRTNASASSIRPSASAPRNRCPMTAIARRLSRLRVPGAAGRRRRCRARSRPATCRRRIGSGRWSRASGANYSHVAIAAFIVNVLALAAPAVHHERVRPRHPERRDPVAGRALDRPGASRSCSISSCAWCAAASST